MARITIHRHAADGSECGLPLDEQEFWDAEPADMHPEHVALQVELEVTGSSCEEPDTGWAGGVEDYEATACGWPIELTVSEHERALEILNSELSRDAGFGRANRRARAAGERRYASYRWS